MNKEEYNDIIINDAVNILNDDGVVILPTDTVYGLAVKSDSEVAKKKVYNIKKRDLNKKLPVIVDTYERLLTICDVNLDDVRKFYPYFPGKLTLVLKEKGSEDTIAVRMINNEVINKIIDKLDCPLLLTSANVSGKENSTDVMKLIEEFDGLVDMVIMGDKVSKVSSTIVELKDNQVILIREGSIPFKEIEETFYRR